MTKAERKDFINASAQTFDNLMYYVNKYDMGKKIKNIPNNTYLYWSKIGKQLFNLFYDDDQEEKDEFLEFVLDTLPKGWEENDFADSFKVAKKEYHNPISDLVVTMNDIIGAENKEEQEHGLQKLYSTFFSMVAMKVNYNIWPKDSVAQFKALWGNESPYLFNCLKNMMNVPISKLHKSKKGGKKHATK